MTMPGLFNIAEISAFAESSAMVKEACGEVQFPEWILWKAVRWGASG
jgi:hypothetical protein